MKPFIKPILWAVALTALLLTVGLYGIDRPARRTDKGPVMVVDTTHSHSEEYGRVEPGGKTRSE